MTGIRPGFRVVGVIDLRDGRAVHARGGVRERYGPVRQVGNEPIAAGDPVALAEAYARLGIQELYAADLDAITSGRPQREAIRSVARVAPLWLDAGISSVAGAQAALDAGAAQIVVGLETLPSFDVLPAICDAVGGSRVAFSLDLRAGTPIARPGVLTSPAPHEIASAAARTGAATLLVIDLARVGAGTGPDAGLLARVRDAAPAVRLVAGGGVAGFDDLRRLAETGCDGALVASAVIDGRLGAPEVAAATRLQRSVSR